MTRSPIRSTWRWVTRALRESEPFDRASFVLFGVLALLVVATFRDYGVTWDEQFHLDYGDRILAFFTSGFQDSSALVYPGGQQPTYGGGFDLLGAAARRYSAFDAFETIHLVGGLVGLLGIVGVWKLGRLLMGPAGGFWSALLLTITPAYYGAMFNNPKDPPFAVGYIWALYGLCALARELPRPTRRRWLVLALCMGAAMCVRVAGIITIWYLVLLIALHGLLRGLAAGSARYGLRTLAKLAPSTFATVVGAWAVMLATWPWAQQDPLRRPLDALAVVSDYNLFVDRRPFGDEQIWSYDPPWDYLPRYFALQLPEVVLLLVAVAVAIVGRASLRHWRDIAKVQQWLPYGILLAAIVVPPAYAIVHGSALYDGLRHFLFLTPPIAVAAGCAATAAGRLLRRRSHSLAWAPYGLLGLAAVHQATVMKHLHPYEYVYFNVVAGGLPGAFDRYDTDYYGASYREAFDCLERYLWQHERYVYLSQVQRLSGCVATSAAGYYRAPHFDWLGFRGRKDAGFFLAYRRNNCHRNGKGHPVVCRVERFGVPLAEVYDLRR